MAFKEKGGPFLVKSKNNSGQSLFREITYWRRATQHNLIGAGDLLATRDGDAIRTLRDS